MKMIKSDKMKKLIFLISLCIFIFSSVPYAQDQRIVTADRIAQESLEKLFWENSSEVWYVGLIFDPSGEPDYRNMLKQIKDNLSEGKISKRDVMGVFGYYAGKEILYLIEHWEEWKEYVSYQEHYKKK